MKTFSSLLFVILMGLFPVFVQADAETGTIATGEKAGDILVRLTPAKRAAGIRLNVKLEGTEWGVHYGVFISEDGLALVGIKALATQQTPSILTAGGTKLDFGKVLKIFPSHGVALMKFNHRPKNWIPLARKLPEVGETIALVTMKADAPNFGNSSPVVGPVMAIRSTIIPRLSAPRFVRILSLGAHLSLGQRVQIGDGSFAVNEKGEVVAFFLGMLTTPSQILTSLYPVAAIADQVGEAVARGEALKFPLSEVDNPIDPAILHQGHYRMVQAMLQRDAPTARKVMLNLLKQFPDSLYLKTLTMNSIFGDPERPLARLEWFPSPNPNDPNKARQIAQFAARGMILSEAGKLVAGIKELEAASRLSPKDYPDVREQLATVYYNTGRFADAERLLKEIYPLFSDTLSYIEKYERLLIKLRSKEAEKLTNRVYELEEIYN